MSVILCRELTDGMLRDANGNLTTDEVCCIRVVKPMPRPPTHRHVLRDLRETIKMTQAALAEAVGVSTVAVNRIENGSLRLSAPVALRISLATGLSMRELMRGKNGRLVDASGEPYTDTTFKRWRTGPRSVSEDSAPPDATNLQWWIEMLLRAAARKHGGRGYQPVRFSLIQAIDAVCTEFKLGKVVESVLVEHGAPLYCHWNPGGLCPTDKWDEEIAVLKELAVTPEDIKKMTQQQRDSIMDTILLATMPNLAEAELHPAKPARRSAGRKRRA